MAVETPGCEKSLTFEEVAGISDHAVGKAVETGLFIAQQRELS
jgi:hypothetical protein